MLKSSERTDSFNQIDYVQNLGFKIDKEISSRRGTIVHRLVDTEGNKLALKTSFKGQAGATPYDQYNLVFREGKIMDRYRKATGGLYVDHGKNSDFSWVITQWLDGAGASDRMKALRKLESPAAFKEAYIELAQELSTPLVQAHKAGLLHGDLQPKHFMTAKPCEKNTILIDWALAQVPTNDDFSYKGAMIHFASPEVTQGMLDERDSINYSTASEVYSFGALLYFLHTEKTPKKYKPEDSFKTKLRALSDGEMISFDEAGADKFMELEELLRCCMAKYPDDRPSSIKEVQESLGNIALKPLIT